jgi:NAD(P)-dependent dehydrogenase (short-subunit alcohol dehydrogenase family)
MELPMATEEHYEPAVRLDGQVALVTGGGRGIGKAIALGLSESGASVAVCARSLDEVNRTAREINERQGRAIAVQADVSSRVDVERMVGGVQDHFGQVDLPVNNAARILPFGSVAETDPDAWWELLEVNLRGPLYCSRAVLPGMIARGRGRIVNVSSGAASMTVPMGSAYIVSKAALSRLSENLAAETTPQGVFVFAIDPGLVRSTMTEAGLSSSIPSIQQMFQGWFDDGENVRPERAARLVAYLASAAADVLSGRHLSVHIDAQKMVASASEIVERDLYVLRQRE